MKLQRLASMWFAGVKLHTAAAPAAVQVFPSSSATLSLQPLPAACRQRRCLQLQGGPSPTMPAAWPTWASLPQELVQQAASLLGDEDRCGEVPAGARAGAAERAGRPGAAAAAEGWRCPRRHRQPWRAAATIVVHRFNMCSFSQAPFLPVIPLPAG
jgi:hypothetical protein